MRPITLSLGGIQDPVVAAALAEIQRASLDTLQNDTSSSGAAMATLVGAAADQIAYFTGPGTTAFAALTAGARGLLALSNFTTPEQFGAKGDGVTDDTTAFAAALAATPAGGTLYLPNKYLVSGSGTEIFLRRTPINILGNSSWTSTIIVASGVPGSRDVFRFAPNAGGVYSNWRIADFTISAQSGTPARYGFNLDTTDASNPQIEAMIIERLVVNQLGGARTIYVNNSIANANGGTYNSIFRDNVLYGAIYLNNAGDSIRIHDNILSATPFLNNTNVGVYVNLIAGAGGTQIIGNNITASGGAVIIDAAASPIVAFNEIEHVSNLADPNNAIVDISGAVSPISGAMVLCNQIQYVTFGGGNPIPLRIDKASNTYYNGNRFSLPSVYVPVVNTANASATIVGAGNFYLGTSATHITDNGTGTLFEMTGRPGSGIGEFVGGTLVGANFNSTADQAITMALAPGRYMISAIIVSNPNVAMTTAVGGFYPAAAKAGNAIVAAAQVYSGLTNVVNGPGSSLILTLTANTLSTMWNLATIYLSLTTPQGSAATADITVLVRPIP